MMMLVYSLYALCKQSYSVMLWLHPCMLTLCMIDTLVCMH